MATQFTVSARLTAKDEASPKIKKAEGSFRSFANYLKGQFVVTAGNAANAVRAAFAQIAESAAIASQTEALRRNLESQRQSYDLFIAKLHEVSDAQVSTADLIKSSNQAILLGIPAEEIASLLEIAKASAIATGTAVTQAFDDIVTGVGRASPMILDNLGIVVNMTEAQQLMADSLGKTVEELTNQERKMVLLQEVQRVGIERTLLYGDAQDETTRAINQSTAALGNFKTGAGNVASALATGLASVVTLVATGFVGLTAALVDSVVQISRLLELLPGVGDAFVGITAGVTRTRDKLNETATSLANMTHQLYESTIAQTAQVLGLEESTEALDDNRREAIRNAEAIRLRNAELSISTDVQESATEATRDGTEQLESYFDSTLDAVRGLDDFTEATRRNSAALRENERSARDAADANSRFAPNLLGGRSSFATIGGGTFTVQQSGSTQRSAGNTRSAAGVNRV